MPAHIAGKGLVTKYRQPLFQTQLEPVAASDAIAGPVVKILMRDDRFNTLIVGVSRRFGADQNAGRVENVKSLVFHRPHVEIIHGNDVEQVQVIFAPVHIFVPFHRLF